MRLTSTCLCFAGALALSTSAGTARADDGGTDAGTGGAGMGTGGGPTGSCDGALGGGGGPRICPSATADNFGCTVSAVTPAPPGSAGAALVLLGLAFAGVRRRRARWARLVSVGAFVPLLLPSAARADASPVAAGQPPAAPAAAAPVAAPSLYTAPSDAPPAEAPPSRIRFGFGANITTDYVRSPTDVSMGAAPPRGGGDVLGIGVFVELGSTEGAGIWSPLVRLTGTRSAMDIGLGAATATATWYTGAVDFCPIAPMLASRLWIRPCARVSGGLLGASATVAGQSLSAHAPWVTGGLLARLTWRPVGPLFFEAQGGAAYAFLHDELDLPAQGTMGAVPVFQPASFEPFGGLGVGLTFP